MPDQNNPTAMAAGPSSLLQGFGGFSDLEEKTKELLDISHYYYKPNKFEKMAKMNKEDSEQPQVMTENAKYFIQVNEEVSMLKPKLATTVYLSSSSLPTGSSCADLPIRILIGRSPHTAAVADPFVMK